MNISKLRGHILGLDYFNPGQRTGYGINAMLMRSPDVLEASQDELTAELAAMVADGLHVIEDDYYWPTTEGQIEKRKFLASCGAMASPLAHQADHGLEDLLLAIAASHTVDFTTGQEFFKLKELQVYLHEFQESQIQTAVEALLHSELLKKYDFDFGDPGLSVHITGKGLRHYMLESRLRLGLDRHEGILRLIESPTADQRIFKLGLDKAFAENIHDRWSEVEGCAAVGAYLAAVILLGSVLEGVLFAKLQLDMKSAMTANKAPRDAKSGSTKALPEWSLQDYVAVAAELGHVPHSVEKHLHELRDTRNLVHPNKQIKANIHVDESLYRISREVAETVIDALAQEKPT